MDINLNSFRFIRGFNYAKNFLLHLKTIKQQQAKIPKKNPSNSLSFSPIAKPSQISQHGSAEKQQQKKSFEHSLHLENQVQNVNKLNKPQIQQTVSSLKNKINILASVLNETHNELTIAQTALQILSSNIQDKKGEIKKIQSLKKQERQKHLRIQVLKASIMKKKNQLQNRQKLKILWKQYVARSVKEYLRQQYLNQSIQIVQYYSKQYKQIERMQQQQEELNENYPQRMNLKYKKIKKKQKKKQEKIVQEKGTFFVKQKKNKSFNKNPESQLFNNQIQKYYDDDVF